MEDKRFLTAKMSLFSVGARASARISGSRDRSRETCFVVIFCDCHQMCQFVKFE